MKKAIWISYDLGVKGDYSGLYAWLDDNNAIECGNSIALIPKYEVVNEHSVITQLETDLKKKVKFNPGDRIYVVRSLLVDGQKKVQGKFVIGKRKSSPWEGYGSKIDDTIDGNE